MTKEQLLEKIEGITNDFESDVSSKEETNEEIAKLVVSFANEAVQRYHDKSLKGIKK